MKSRIKKNLVGTTAPNKIIKEHGKVEAVHGARRVTRLLAGLITNDKGMKACRLLNNPEKLKKMWIRLSAETAAKSSRESNDTAQTAGLG